MEGLSLNLLENTDMHSIALKHANENGFTLIEALIATVLLVIGLLSYASFTGNLVVQNTKNDRKTMAVSYAQEKL